MWQYQIILEFFIDLLLKFNLFFFIFSTVENIEGQWAMAGKPLTNLSVEQVVDCDGMEDIPR